MEISGFDVNPDNHMITIHLTDMPRTGARTTNTSVSIAGSPLDAPEEVSGARGTVVVFGGSAKQSGNITVTITTDEDTFVATSAEEYQVEDPHEDKDPVILSVSPTEAKPGDEITMRGRNLAGNAIVAVVLGGRSINAPRTTPTAVYFKIPNDMFPGPYSIAITGRNIGVRKPTRFRIMVVPKEAG